MIQLAMVFALGFLVAGLLTLLFLPAFWRRAVRLSTRRLEAQMPLSMPEIVAERDQLRAMFAAEQRRLEQKLEDVSEKRAGELSELGRRATRIAGLEAELAAIEDDRKRLLATLADVGERLLAAETEAGAVHQAHWAALNDLEASRRDKAATEEGNRGLRDQNDERRTVIAGLETRVSGLEMQLEDSRRRYDAAERVVIDQTIEIAKLQEERDFFRAEAASATARRDQLQATAAARDERIAELEQAHRVERRGRARLEGEMAASARALAGDEERRKATQASFERQLAEVSTRERDLRQQIEDLRAERGALEGALEVARREFALLRADQAGRPAAAPASAPAARESVSVEDARALRQSIREVGDEISWLVAALQLEADEGSGSAERAPGLDERVRALQAREKRVVTIR